MCKSPTHRYPTAWQNYNSWLSLMSFSPASLTRFADLVTMSSAKFLNRGQARIMRVYICALIAAIAAAFMVAPAQAKPDKSALVLDIDTGKVLYASAADQTRYPASLTKMMTLYMVFDKLQSGEWQLNTKLWTSPQAAKQEPSKIGLKKRPIHQG